MRRAQHKQGTSVRHMCCTVHAPLPYHAIHPHILKHNPGALHATGADAHHYTLLLVAAIQGMSTHSSSSSREHTGRQGM
jgi:hypothetical protein